MAASPCVMVVDDDPQLRAFLREYLELHGYQVVTASNGRDALQQVQRTRLDAVLADILMPDMDGLELIMSLNQSHPNLPVVAVTGGGMLHDPAVHLNNARYLGATAVLTKPFDLEALLRVMQRIVNPGGVL